MSKELEEFMVSLMSRLEEIKARQKDGTYLLDKTLMKIQKLVFKLEE